MPVASLSGHSALGLRPWKAEFINCSALPRGAGFPGEAMPQQDGGGRYGAKGCGRVDGNQPPLSGQSREKDPGLLTPALSLDLHSNRHQGTGAEGRAELAACRREGRLWLCLFCWKKDSGPGSRGRARKGGLRVKSLAAERPRAGTNEGDLGLTSL